MKTETIPLFKNKFSGNLVLPDDDAYDNLCNVYNGMIHKKPALIAQCRTVGEVQDCVNFARENNVLLSIRGGGHNAGGLGICEGGLAIDLSLMKNIHVDKDAKTVRAEGGVLFRELDAATHEVGMAVPGGIVGSTGIAGLTLGGGLGHLTRKYGLTIDSLLSADVVLADGRFVTASANECADLFWALHGGGGNFGVVVSFLYRLNPVHTVYAGPMLWHVDDTKEVMRWYRDFITSAPDDINGFFAFLIVPPVAPFPEHLHLKNMCGIVWCYTGTLESAPEVFKPIRGFIEPALDFVGPIPLPALQTMFDALYPAGLQWYWKADFVNDLSNEAIDLHYQFGKALPTMLSSMHLYPITGAAGRVGRKETAWNYRHAKWAQVIVGVDPDEKNNDSIMQWARDYWTALHPFSAGGAYINFLMDEGETMVQASYGDNYKRLVQIKTKYDPNNLFRVNQNIRPEKQKPLAEAMA